MMRNRGLKISVALLTFLFVGASATGGYIYYIYSEDLARAESKIASSTERIALLEENLEKSQQDNIELSQRLQNKEEEVGELSDIVSELTGNVGTLQKLQEIDEELLQKYSRVYFLNEHYVPSDLRPIDDEYVLKEKEIEEIHGKVKPFLEDMLEEAEDDDVDLRIISAYRSFDEQTSLKNHYNIVYGEGTANQFSASQGYSEHQLGTTIDFTTPELGVNFTQFDQAEAYEWLLDNAHKYGFVLSYPENNSYYVFEPWHWRFVGVDLAEDLHDDDMNFYDMPQREIDEYLVNLFD